MRTTPVAAAPVTDEPLGVRTLVMVTAVTVLTKGPLFLPGAVSDLIHRDIGLGPSGIGLIIALFWTGSIIGAHTSRNAGDGGLVERRTGGALLATALALVAAGAWPRSGLWAAAAVGGFVYGYTQPHTNFLLVHRCAKRIHGLVFGVKQASVPLAALFCSLAVPVIAIPVGWRPLLAGAGLLCAVQAASLLARASTGGTRWKTRLPGGRLPLDGYLFALAAAGACGSAVGMSLGGFLISSLTHSGNSALTASMLASTGSVTAIAARIVVGRLVDRSPGRPQRLLKRLFTLGAAGTALLTIPHLAAQILGTLLAFGGGWGWAGLLHYTASAAYPDREGQATAITQMGVSLGGVLGPLGFGVLVEATSHAAAWGSMTFLGLAAYLWIVQAARQSPAVAVAG